MLQKIKNLHHSYLLAIALLLIIAIFFSFYHLGQLYGFEFDQERDYYLVKSMVVDHKISLIGPRVVSSAGFYLGPWYYYLQIPFFIALSGNPLYGAVFTGFVNVLICLLIYLVLRYISQSRLVPLLAAALWVSSSNRSNWNVQFVPLFLLMFLYFYWQIHKKYHYLSLWFLTLTLSLAFNFHPQMAFLAPIWPFGLYQYIKHQQKITLKQIALLLVALIGPFLTLIFFDLRHNFVNARAALGFLSSSSANNSGIALFRFSYSLRQFSTALDFIHPLFHHNLPATAIFLGLAFILALKYSKYFFLITLPLISILVLAFYRQATWPEYYHYLGGFSLFILLFLIVGQFRLGKLLLTLLTLIVLWANIHYITSFIYPGSYYFKKAMILYMLKENQPYQKINIINDFRYGDGLGFQPIREYYEPKTGAYNPKLSFYVSYLDSPKHNSTKKAFGYFAISLIN